MKRNCLVTLLSSAALAVSLNVHANSLQRADLPANTAMLLHFDCDALRSSSIGEFILSEMDKPEAQAKLGAFQAIFNFDLRTQLHGLTLYNTGTNAPDGILLVYADVYPERLVTLAKAAQDYKSSEHNTHTIHSWIDKGKRRHGKRAYAAIQGSRVVIFGQREASVAAALDVLDGGANLSTGNGFPQLDSSGKGAFLQAAGRKISFNPTDPNTALLRLSDEIRLQMRQSEGQLTATLSLDAANSEVASNMTSIAQGLVALGKLQGGNPDAQKLANAITLRQDDASLAATLSLPASDVVEMMKRDAARKAAKKEAEEN